MLFFSGHPGYIRACKHTDCQQIMTITSNRQCLTYGSPLSLYGGWQWAVDKTHAFDVGDVGLMVSLSKTLNPRLLQTYSAIESCFE